MSVVRWEDGSPLHEAEHTVLAKKQQLTGRPVKLKNGHCALVKEAPPPCPEKRQTIDEVIYGPIVLKEGECIADHIEFVASPLVDNLLLAKKLTVEGISPNCTASKRIQILEAIRGLAIDGLYDYNQLLGMKRGE